MTILSEEEKHRKLVEQMRKWPMQANEMLAGFRGARVTLEYGVSHRTARIIGRTKTDNFILRTYWTQFIAGPSRWTLDDFRISEIGAPADCHDGLYVLEDKRPGFRLLARNFGGRQSVPPEHENAMLGRFYSKDDYPHRGEKND